MNRLSTLLNIKDLRVLWVQRFLSKAEQVSALIDLDWTWKVRDHIRKNLPKLT